MKKLLSTLLLLAATAQAVDNGKPAPDFSLPDLDGKARTLAEFKGKHVVLEWVNHGCPFVKKHYDSDNMQALQKEFTGKGVVWLSICSSAEGKQGHMSAADWKKATADKGAAPTAVLIDADGKVGKLYGAKTTPHMYIVDPKGVLVYQGAIDDKDSYDKTDVQGSRNHVREALNESLAGKPVSKSSTTPYGCSVKYK